MFTDLSATAVPAFFCYSVFENKKRVKDLHILYPCVYYSVVLQKSDIFFIEEKINHPYTR